MLDPKVIEQMIQDQVTTMVTDQVMQVFASDSWLQPLENKIVQHTQDHLLRKFSNAAAMPEIIAAVKQGVTELFTNGQIPNLVEFINPATITLSINQAVDQAVVDTISTLHKDPQWLSRVETMISQTVTRQTVAQIGSMDINTVIKDRVDENVEKFYNQLTKNFKSVGIVDQATQTQLTIMDDHTVFENNLTARDLTIANSAVINNLAVTGSINTDNQSWKALADEITANTLQQLTDKWQDTMVESVAASIKTDGIDFDKVTIDGQPLIDGTRLNHIIKETSIQTTGILRSLHVSGSANLNETLNVNRKRVGVNTEEPEMALSVWDEEVAINLGKNKLNQAYIGTSRAQGIAFGTNRVAHIEVTADGLTQIKKLQIGLHKISHATEVPGWSGTKGDIVFNANLGADRVFAWVCLGAYKWQPLKSAE